MPLPGVIDVINLIYKLFIGSSVFLFCVYIALSATGSWLTARVCYPKTSNKYVLQRKQKLLQKGMGLVSLIADPISRLACFPGKSGRRRMCLCLLSPWAGIPVSSRARSCGEQRGTEGPLGQWSPGQGVGQIQELTALAVPASLTHAACVPGLAAMNESQSSRGVLPGAPCQGQPRHCWCFPGFVWGEVCKGRRVEPAIAVISHANQAAGIRQGVLKFIQAIT